MVIIVFTFEVVPLLDDEVFKGFWLIFSLTSFARSVKFVFHTNTCNKFILEISLINVFRRSSRSGQKKVLTNLSSPAEEKLFPLEEKHAALTAPAWPVKVKTGCPSNKSSICNWTIFLVHVKPYLLMYIIFSPSFFHLY